ncbi:MAG: 23S rRNA (guanosine(2251)-2'-O)-methyltransferase RlmB [Clostridia bacterium]|nr:23S rRNA (guanosine(2251)-2'-O)-methyltransferase RlmB [Clostridia bacterium]
MKYESDARNASRAAEDTVYGRNAVLELLSSGQPVDKIYLQRDGEGVLKKIYALAKERGIPVGYADREKLDRMTGGGRHQGAVAVATGKEYAELEDLFDLARERGEDPLFVLADGVEDPHNLGALIRCLDGAGAHGIIIPRAGGASVNGAVMKASAGAAAHVPVCRVANLPATVDKLKKMGVWIYACEADGQPYDKVDYRGPAAIVLGSEGSGVSRLLREKSDFVISLPMRGKVNSLNVSCAGAVVLYEVLRQRSDESVKR